MTRMQPLSFDPDRDPASYGPPAAVRCIRWIPVVGFIVNAAYWNWRFSPVKEALDIAILSRQGAEREWSRELYDLQLAGLICEIAREEMCWRGSSFIPDDPLRVVLWSFNDGLDIDYAIQRIEEAARVEILDADLEQLWSQTLGDFVRYISERRNDRMA